MGFEVTDEEKNAMREVLERCLVPQNAIYEGSVVVTSYLDNEGDGCFSVWYDHDRPMLSTFGLLKMAELHLARQWMQSEDDE